MSRNTKHVLTGTLRASGPGLYALEADGGGVWQLDIGWACMARRLVGRRVEVTGWRAGFDLLDVTSMGEI